MPMLGLDCTYRNQHAVLGYRKRACCREQGGDDAGNAGRQTVGQAIRHLVSGIRTAVLTPSESPRFQGTVRLAAMTKWGCSETYG